LFDYWHKTKSTLVRLLVSPLIPVIRKGFGNKNLPVSIVT
jgi:hypothetical protein